MRSFQSAIAATIVPSATIVTTKVLRAVPSRAGMAGRLSCGPLSARIVRPSGRS